MNKRGDETDMASLYEDILEIAPSYMGIAAKEYIDRRCRIAARDVPPEEFTFEKLDRLCAGVDMTAKVYMSPERAEAFMKQIEALKDRAY